MKTDVCCGRGSGIEDAGDGPDVGFAACDGVEEGAGRVVDLEVFGEEAWFGGDGEGEGGGLLLRGHCSGW